MAQDCQLLF